MAPLVNRGFCSSIGLHRNSSVRVSRDTPRRICYDGLVGKKGSVVFSANRPVGVLSCPSPPRPAAPPCAAPSRPIRGMSRFWIRQVGLHRISFVRAFAETTRTAVLVGRTEVAIAQVVERIQISVPEITHGSETVPKG